MTTLESTGSISAWGVDEPGPLTPAISQFLQDNEGLSTPFLVLDLDVVENRYHALLECLPVSRVFYAVKANPAPEVLLRLFRAGSSFDVASPGEIDRCLNLGIHPDHLAYGNTIKKERDIAYAHRRGVRTFTIDAEVELDKVIRQAPGSTVYIRISTDGAGADWPLSRKFGCGRAEALCLARTAVQAGLRFGFSFHVGSQQRDVNAWDRPLEMVAGLLRTLRGDGIEAAGVNLGGGLPSRYRDAVADIGSYGEAIARAVATHLGEEFPAEILIEPGRYLVGDAGVIETEVVLISNRRPDDERRWVYLDIGLFNGLTETLGEAIRYRVRTARDLEPVGPVVLAGPSCDSADVLYEKSGYQLPLKLRVGDRMQLLATGAYTASYSSVWFNGFEPLNCFFVSTDEPTDQTLSG